MKKLIAFAIAVALAGTIYAQESPARFATATPIGSDAWSPTSFTFATGKWSCRVSSEGGSQCTDGPKTWRFTIPTDGAKIEALFVSGSDPLVIAYELTDEESNWASVVSVRPGKHRADWKAHVRGLNLAPPVRVSATAAVVAALAFVGSINLDDGTYRWRHECLYDGSGRTATELLFRGDLIEVRSMDFEKPETALITCYGISTGEVLPCSVSPN